MENINKQPKKDPWQKHAEQWNDKLAENMKRAVSIIKGKDQPNKGAWKRLTEQWDKEMVPSKAEQVELNKLTSARHYELHYGLRDIAGLEVLEAGEPTYGEVKDKFPGFYADDFILAPLEEPFRKYPMIDCHKFRLRWNGALFCDLAHPIRDQMMNEWMLALGFFVGRNKEIYGKAGDRYQRLTYMDGYLPIAVSKYVHENVQYRQTAFAAAATREYKGRNLCLIRFAIESLAAQAEFRLSISIHDLTESAGALKLGLVEAGPGSSPPATTLKFLNAKFKDGLVRDHRGQILCAWHSNAGVSFKENEMVFSGTTRKDKPVYVYLKVPSRRLAKGVSLQMTEGEFECGFEAAKKQWQERLESGVQIHVPEKEIDIEKIVKALLVQNFLMTDGDLLKYGSPPCSYGREIYLGDTSKTVLEMARYGFCRDKNHIKPLFLNTPKKYSAIWHSYHIGWAARAIYEIYLLTQDRTFLKQCLEHLGPVADSIIRERHKTMVAGKGKKPLHWGMMAPASPGGDLAAWSPKVYSLHNNIPCCVAVHYTGLCLKELGNKRAGHYLQEARGFRAAIDRAIDGSMIKEGGDTFLPFVLYRVKKMCGSEPYHFLQENRDGAYYAIWADILLEEEYFAPLGDHAGILAATLENHGGLFCGVTRWTADVLHPNYSVGYTETKFLRDELNYFLLCFYGKLAHGFTRTNYLGAEQSPWIIRSEGVPNPAINQFPNSAANAAFLRNLRIMLIYEEKEHNVPNGTLRLCYGTPRRWLEDGKTISVSKFPTFFGEMGLEVRSEIAQGRITVRIEPPQRGGCKAIKLRLRHPDRAKLKKVYLNEKEHKDFSIKDETITFQPDKKTCLIQARY